MNDELRSPVILKKQNKKNQQKTSYTLIWPGRLLTHIFLYIEWNNACRSSTRRQQDPANVHNQPLSCHKYFKAIFV